MKVMADFYKVPLSKIVFDEEDSYIVLDDKDER